MEDSVSFCRRKQEHGLFSSQKQHQQQIESQLILSKLLTQFEKVGWPAGSGQCGCHGHILSSQHKGPFINYVDKMRGGRDQKIFVFVHDQGIKAVHAGGWWWVKKWQNFIHIVVECPPREITVDLLFMEYWICRYRSEGTKF